MKTKNINSVLKEVLEKIKPPKEDLEIIKKSLREFLEKFEKNLKSLKINADVFIGGSFAKKTVIKKDYYDIDIFFRFDKKYKSLVKIYKMKVCNSTDHQTVRKVSDRQMSFR